MKNSTSRQAEKKRRKQPNRFIRGAMTAALAVSMLGFVAPTAEAAPAWYRGKITRLFLYSNAKFVITVDSGVLDDCETKYAYFDGVHAAGGEAHVKELYAMALAAYHSGADIDVVINKGAAGDRCYVKSMDVSQYPHG